MRILTTASRRPFVTTNWRCVSPTRTGERGYGNVKALPFVHHGLVIDLTLNEVSLNGRGVSLSRLEFEVLRTLAENEGNIVGYDQILRESWRDPAAQLISKLRHVIHLLRLKLGRDNLGRSFIVTDSRAGYGIRREDSAMPRTIKKSSKSGGG